jgi:hypothetical protein
MQQLQNLKFHNVSIKQKHNKKQTRTRNQNMRVFFSFPKDETYKNFEEKLENL